MICQIINYVSSTISNDESNLETSIKKEKGEEFANQYLGQIQAVNLFRKQAEP
jgi:hypothetical protein